MRGMLVDHVKFFADLRHKIGPKNLAEREDIGFLCRPIHSNRLRSERQLIPFDGAGEDPRVTRINLRVLPTIRERCGLPLGCGSELRDLL